MVRANICPSIYQRTDAQTFLESGRILAALHTTTTTNQILLLLAGPLFFETMWQMD